jgi:hypothetical protein
MERIEKLTEIYHEHMELINGDKIEKKNLKNCLIDILDSAASGSRSTCTSALGFSPVKGSQTNNGSMMGFTSFQPADISTNQNGIRGNNNIFVLISTCLDIGILPHLLQVFQLQK